jgi:hypothetical protein
MQVIKFDWVVVARRMQHHAVCRRPRHHAQADGAIEDLESLLAGLEAIPQEKGIDRPEEKDHLSLGKARHQVLGADRSTYGLDLYLWRYLPKRR